MRAECCPFPFSEAWYAYSAVFGGAGHCYNVEVLFHGPEGFVGKQTFAGNGCVFVEYRHLFGSISFCKDGYVDAFGRIVALQQIFMWCDVGSTFLMYQDVVGTDRMFHACPYISTRVEKCYFYFCRTEGIGKEKGVFESFGHRFGFIRFQPLLEERRKGCFVDYAAIGCISHNDLSVSLQGQLR